MKRREFVGRSALAALLLPVIGGFSSIGSAAESQNKALILASASVTPSIVIAPDAAESEKYAAQELAEYLGKIIDKTIEIVASNDGAPGTPQVPLIVLGRHPQNADLQPEKMGIEESVISVETGRIRIVGGGKPPLVNDKGGVYAQSRGTLYGVYNLLDELGVRWYRPEPWGEHVPKLVTVSLPQGKKNYKPSYTYRGGMSMYRWFSDQTPEQSRMAQTWAVRNRQNAWLSVQEKHGGSYYVQTHHNYRSLLPNKKYYAEHPEYFALVNGKRVEHIDAQPCIGNPEVRVVMAQNLIAQAKANPHVQVYSVEPNDGNAYNCECELCRALDDPALLAANGGVERLGKASMSNRVSFLNNYLARELGKAIPGKSVAWLAYLDHTEVPTKVREFEPNTYVAPAAFAAAYSDFSRKLHDPESGGNRNFLKLLTGYGKMTTLLTREYWSGYCWYGPLPILSVLEDRLKEYRKYNVQGIYSEMHPSWGPQTNIHYFFTRLMWDSDLDMDKALEEFCHNYYGPAGEHMLAYERLLEKSAQSGPAFYFSGRFVDRLFVSDELMDKMTPLMEKARAAVAGKAPYEQRLEGAWAGYEVARRRNLVEHYKKQKNVLQAVATWDELEQFIRSYSAGDVFDNGGTMFPQIWRTMTSQAGIAGLRNQIATLKKTPGAAILQNLSDEWKFSTDPKQEGMGKGVIEPAFNDAEWRTVSGNSTWQEQGFNYHGSAWYRKAFELNEKEAGKKYVLFFGAVDGNAIIYVNGREVGQHLLDAAGGGWDEDFMIDITEALKGGKNTIAVHVTKNTAVAGIYKGVVLMRL